MAKSHPHLKLVKSHCKDTPAFSIPDSESDIHDAAENWLADQMIDGRREDFICDREDFRGLLSWSLVTWKNGKPYLFKTNLGTHRIRVPGTRFA
jgi:hypothetical protein